MIKLMKQSLEKTIFVLRDMHAFCQVSGFCLLILTLATYYPETVSYFHLVCCAKRKFTETI